MARPRGAAASARLAAGAVSLSTLGRGTLPAMVHPPAKHSSRSSASQTSSARADDPAEERQTFSSASQAGSLAPPTVIFALRPYAPCFRLAREAAVSLPCSSRCPSPALRDAHWCL